jgi:uncharacterized protein (TIGR00299 family) protein
MDNFGGVMKIIRFDSVGGASGDMILGALIGLGADIDILNRELASLLPSEKFEITVSPKESHGINGIAATVEIDELHSHHHAGQHEHHHHQHDGRTFADIRQLIAESRLTDTVKAMTVKVFTALAEAEGRVHNMTADQVHFHEVGAVDSIVDIAGCCLAMELLGIQGISVSPLPSGQGTFKCCHGIYPIPAPATVELMKNLKSVLTEEPYELVTPTGAALLSVWPHLEIPPGSMIIKTANSFGQRALNSRPNLLRAILYETAENNVTEQNDESDSAIVLETNIDDCPAEFIGPLFERLFHAGALDVWTTPILMKKQRPGIMLSVICKTSCRTNLYDIIFRETTTFGIREYPVFRQCLERRFEQVETPFGKVSVKTGSRNGQDITSSPEIDDCIRLSAQSKVSVREVYLAAVKAAKL